MRIYGQPKIGYTIGRPPSGRVPGSGRQAGLHPSWSGRCSRLRRADACLVPSQSLARRSWSPCPAHLVPSGGTADAGREPGCPASRRNDLGSGGGRPKQAVSETTGIERQPVVNRAGSCRQWPDLSTQPLASLRCVRARPGKPGPGSRSGRRRPPPEPRGARLGPCGERSFARDPWRRQDRLAAPFSPPSGRYPSLHASCCSAPTRKSGRLTVALGAVLLREGATITMKQVLPSRPSGFPVAGGDPGGF